MPGKVSSKVGSSPDSMSRARKSLRKNMQAQIL